MTRRRILLAMLIATKAMVSTGQKSTAAATTNETGLITDAGVDLTRVEMIRVHHHERGCNEPPTKVDFWPTEVCIQAEGTVESIIRSGPVWWKLEKVEVGGTTTWWTRRFYWDESCTSEVTGETIGASWWQPSRLNSTSCSTFCTGLPGEPGQPSECKGMQGIQLEGHVGVGSVTYFNESSCGGTADGPHYFAVDMCVPGHGYPRYGSAVVWARLDGLGEAHYFTSSDCTGESAPVRDIRPADGTCGEFSEHAVYPPGQVSYKMWLDKRFDTRYRPRCAWISERIAKEIKAIAHPDSQCKEGEVLSNDSKTSDGGDYFGDADFTL